MTRPYSVRPKQTVSMQTSDRVRLDADVYTPEGTGPFPVLLMRQPYGRAIASTVVYAHPSWYAAQGFIVVIQDVRGRGTSEGTFRLFETETQDGFETIEWAATLPQSNGQVGMYGFSYQGMTQLFAAAATPPALKAIAPAMVGYHPYEDWAYENGVPLLQAGVGWAIQLAAETARLRGDRPAFQALYEASRQLPIHDETPLCPSVLRQHAPGSFFHDWLSHPQPDDYWQKITPKLDTVDLPMLHVGGWFDPYLRGDLRLYHEMVSRSQSPQPLWVGPWGHIPWGRQAGIRDFGPAANSPIDRVQVEWFGHWLRDDPAHWRTAPPIHWFEMGSDRWRSFAAWPTPTWQSWHLASTGLAAIDQRNGKLMPADPSRVLDETDPTNHATSAIDTWVHDPWRPVPSLGGHAAIPAGVFNRAAIDTRSDVVTYTSAPLAQPISIAGQVEVVLRCRCDRPSFDLSLTLSEVRSDGAVFAITQGYGRFTRPENTWQSCRLLLHPTCSQIPARRALRLSISAASFPAYPVNPGYSAIAHETRLMESQIITLTLACDRNETLLRLPVLSSGEDFSP